jgi:hypothetical protein
MKKTATITEPRKTRKDAKLSAETLGAEKFAELKQMLLASCGYDVSQQWMLENFGWGVSDSTWSEFHKREIRPILRAQVQFAAMGAKSIEDMARESEAFDEANLLELRRRANQMLRDPNADPKETRAWLETYVRAMATQKERDKLKAATKTDIEKGLEALLAEIKGNKKAEAIFAQLQEVVKAA